MPSFISKDGVWEPRVEKVALKDEKGEPFVYEGPDREATKMIAENGGSLGTFFKDDPQIIELAHARNMTIEKVTKSDTIYTDDKREKEFQAKKKEKVLHADPSRKAPDNIAGGGVIPSNPSISKKGGFGEPAELPTGKKG